MGSRLHDEASSESARSEWTGRATRHFHRHFSSSIWFFFFLLFGNSFIGPRRASNKLIDSRWPSHRPLARALARPLLERNAYRQRNNNKQRARESSRLLSHYTTAVALDSATLSLHLLLFFASSLFVVPNWLVNYMGKSFCMRARHKAPGFFFLLTLSMFLCYLP